MTVWVMLDREKHELDPRACVFIVESARKWHKTPQQAFDRIVNGGLKILMANIQQVSESAKQEER